MIVTMTKIINEKVNKDVDVRLSPTIDGIDLVCDGLYVLKLNTNGTIYRYRYAAPDNGFIQGDNEDRIKLEE